MATKLTSKRYQAEDYAQAQEIFFKNGWSDGLPVIPPTENRVADLMDYVGLAPEQIVGEVPERNRVLTAEKLAINAVMAGCLPEYMPVLIAAVEAITDPKFKFNHLASLGSPWPLIIVNGPIAKQIELHSGIYLFGPGQRPNLTIARAISLLLRNCAEAKAEGIQRGQWGNTLRFMGCVAENEETPWTPLHVMLGHRPEESTVTVLSCYPGVPFHITCWLLQPEHMLKTICETLPYINGSQWNEGVHTLFFGPHQVEAFVKEGWTKEKVRQHIMDNTKSSIAELKRRQAWAVQSEEGFREELLQIEPGDEDKYVYLFKDHGEYNRFLVRLTSIADRWIHDLFVVVGGGNAGQRAIATSPYGMSTNPVIKLVKTK